MLRTLKDKNVGKFVSFIKVQQLSSDEDNNLACLITLQCQIREFFLKKIMLSTWNFVLAATTVNVTNLFHNSNVKLLQNGK
jgi:hypothetical protein